jgi:hypothetical protein
MFSKTQLALCLWHVNVNVIKNCKSYFDHDIWISFYNDWQKIVYVETETLYEEIWIALQAKYDNEDHWLIIEYLIWEILDKWNIRVIEYWINEMFSFDNIITSQAEDKHVKLKRELRSFIEN